MQINPASLLLLKKLSAKKRAEKRRAASPSVAVNHQRTADSKSRKERFQDWLSPKPADIQSYPGENEIFRKGLVLVTDTRLAYIDPFDRMLKTYMFEHMISVHKQFYQTTAFNRHLCKGLLILSVIVFFIILTIDLLDSGSRVFFIAYIPLFASILIGLKVWNDMKPRYVLHWRMRDHTYGEIAQEPFLSERLKGETKRETFMTDLVNAMNQALSAKAWCAAQNYLAQNNTAEQRPHTSAQQQAADSSDSSAPKLTLVTDSYQ